MKRGIQLLGRGKVVSKGLLDNDSRILDAARFCERFDDTCKEYWVELPDNVPARWLSQAFSSTGQTSQLFRNRRRRSEARLGNHLVVRDKFSVKNAATALPSMTYKLFRC
jgi:hypothetical protein